MAPVCPVSGGSVLGPPRDGAAQLSDGDWAGEQDRPYLSNVHATRNQFKGF
jgi:hypothetical protein